MSKFLFFLYYVSFFSFSSAFDLEQNEPLKYGAESIVTADYNNDGDLIISNASDTLNLSFRAGFGLSSDFRYARIDITNGAFNSSLPSSGVMTSGAYSSLVMAGGSAGDQYVVIELSASPSIDLNTLLTLETDSFAWFDISESLNIRYTLFDTATAAINNFDYLYRTEAILAKVVSAIGENFTHYFSHTAGFSQDFFRFNSTFRSPGTFALGDATSTLASMGKVLFNQLIIDGVLLPSTSNVISDFRLLFLEVDMTIDSAIINGDFSAATAFLNANDDCTGASHVLSSYSNVSEVAISIDTLVSFPVLCLSAESNDVFLKRSTYEIDIALGAGARVLGELNYDAAFIDIPYITTFQSYKQRILLVNHTGYDVAYTTRFIAESEVLGHFYEGDLTSGIIKGNSTLKLNTEDLVTIGANVPTRISARIFLDAKPSDISAAIQILSIGSLEPPKTSVLGILQY
jgi:hypothetical protein